MAGPEEPTEQDVAHPGQKTARGGRKGSAGHLREYQFKKGENGKLGGRQRASRASIAAAVKKRLRQQPKLAQMLADALFREALAQRGSERLKAIGMLLEMLGEAKAAVELGGLPSKHVMLGGDVPEGLPKEGV